MNEIRKYLNLKVDGNSNEKIVNLLKRRTFKISNTKFWEL